MGETIMKNKKNKIIILIVLLLVLGIGVAYAYVAITASNNFGTRTASALMECLDITYSESGTINLTNQYPVEDSVGLSGTPVTVTITNTCTSNSANINYTLALATLRNASGYIADTAIRSNVKRTVGTASETTLIDTTYLSNYSTLTSGNVYTYINNKISSLASTNIYTNKTIYRIDSSSIANNTTVVYKLYLWVDYYEGDTTHTGAHDNDTQNNNFVGYLSVVINGDTANATGY